jgi:hypothetical protein
VFDVAFAAFLVVATLRARRAGSPLGVITNGCISRSSVISFDISAAPIWS